MKSFIALGALALAGSSVSAFPLFERDHLRHLQYYHIPTDSEPHRLRVLSSIRGHPVLPTLVRKQLGLLRPSSLRPHLRAPHHRSRKRVPLAASISHGLPIRVCLSWSDNAP